MALGALSLLLSAGEMAYGIYQDSQAKKPEQPEYDVQIPDSIKRSLELQQRRAAAPRMPGERIATEQMQTAQATQLQTAKRSGNMGTVMSALENQYSQELGMIQQQAIARAKYRDQNQQRYQQGLQQYGQMEQQIADKKWEWEEARPYIQDYQQYQADKQAGFQNIMSGLSGAMKTGEAMMQQEQLTGQYENMYDIGGDVDTGGQPPITTDPIPDPTTNYNMFGTNQWT